MLAIKMLAELLKSKFSRSTTRQVVFLDELHCFDTLGCGFIKVLDFFWNGSASWRDNIMIVVCMSPTSRMIKNLIHSKGGLHKWLTHDIPLYHSNLALTEKSLTPNLKNDMTTQQKIYILLIKRPPPSGYLGIGGANTALAFVHRNDGAAAIDFIGEH